MFGSQAHDLDVSMTREDLCIVMQKHVQNNVTLLRCVIVVGVTRQSFPSAQFLIVIYSARGERDKLNKTLLARAEGSWMLLSEFGYIR